MVAFKIFWLSSSLNFSSPYKSNWSKLLSSRKRVVYLSSMGLIVAKSTFLGLTKFGQLIKKWQVVSAVLSLQLQIALGVSSNLCAFLWLLRGLNPTRSWKIHLIPLSCMLNKLFLVGRYNFNRLRLKTASDSEPRSSGPRSFHKETLSGKKLSLYRWVVLVISLRLLL